MKLRIAGIIKLIKSMIRPLLIKRIGLILMLTELSKDSNSINKICSTSKKKQLLLCSQANINRCLALNDGYYDLNHSEI